MQVFAALAPFLQSQPMNFSVQPCKEKNEKTAVITKCVTPTPELYLQKFKL